MYELDFRGIERLTLKTSPGGRCAVALLPGREEGPRTVEAYVESPTYGRAVFAVGAPETSLVEVEDGQIRRAETVSAWDPTGEGAPKEYFLEARLPLNDT